MKLMGLDLNGAFALMRSSTAPIARNILRFAAGGIGGAAYVGKAPLELNDDMVVLLSIFVGMAVEVFYFIAKRRGWAT